MDSIKRLEDAINALDYRSDVPATAFWLKQPMPVSWHVKQLREALSALKAEGEPVAWAVESNVSSFTRMITHFFFTEDDADKFSKAPQAHYAGCARKKIPLYASPLIPSTTPTEGDMLDAKRYRILRNMCLHSRIIWDDNKLTLGIELDAITDEAILVAMASEGKS